MSGLSTPSDAEFEALEAAFWAANEALLPSDREPVDPATLPQATGEAAHYDPATGTFSRLDGSPIDAHTGQRLYAHRPAIRRPQHRGRSTQRRQQRRASRRVTRGSPLDASSSRRSDDEPAPPGRIRVAHTWRIPSELGVAYDLIGGSP